MRGGKEKGAGAEEAFREIGLLLTVAAAVVPALEPKKEGMRPITTLVWCFGWLLVLGGCAAARYTPQSLPEQRLYFGDGGGFAEVHDTFLLLENGQLFRTSNQLKGYEELQPIEPGQARHFFKAWSESGLEQLSVNSPGRHYFFLRRLTPLIDHSLVWGAADYSPPLKVVALYKELHRLAASRPVLRRFDGNGRPLEKKKKPEEKPDKPKDNLAW